MFSTFSRRRSNRFRKMVSGLMLVVFSLSTLPSQAQMAMTPIVANALNLSPAFQSPTLKGLNIHAENPFLLDFIVHTGNDRVQGEALKAESERLVKFFLAALTIPDKEAWVNLSPAEADRIIPEALSKTEMGKVMLEQDYILKQLSSSLTDPDTELGKKYWQEVDRRSQKNRPLSVPAPEGDSPLRGSPLSDAATDLNAVSKVWIVPAKAEIAEKDGKVYVTASRLNVMMQEDYAALPQELEKANRPHQNPAPSTQNPLISHNVIARDSHEAISTSVFRELILPKLIEEVNEGKNFAPVRQIYDAAILAVWYKNSLKESLLGQIYVDQHKVKGVEIADKDFKNKIYSQYLEAFRKGVYNIIKEEYDAAADDIIPRKYFSGGIAQIAPQLEQITRRPGVGSSVVITASGASASVTVQLDAEQRAADRIAALAARQTNIAGSAVAEIVVNAFTSQRGVTLSDTERSLVTAFMNEFLKIVDNNGPIQLSTEEFLALQSRVLQNNKTATVQDYEDALKKIGIFFDTPLDAYPIESTLRSMIERVRTTQRNFQRALSPATAASGVTEEQRQKVFAAADAIYDDLSKDGSYRVEKIDQLVLQGILLFMYQKLLDQRRNGALTSVEQILDEGISDRDVIAIANLDPKKHTQFQVDRSMGSWGYKWNTAGSQAQLDRGNKLYQEIAQNLTVLTAASGVTADMIQLRNTSGLSEDAVNETKQVLADAINGLVAMNFDVDRINRALQLNWGDADARVINQFAAVVDQQDLSGAKPVDLVGLGEAATIWGSHLDVLKKLAGLAQAQANIDDALRSIGSEHVDGFFPRRAGGSSGVTLTDLGKEQLEYFYRTEFFPAQFRNDPNLDMTLEIDRAARLAEDVLSFLLESDAKGEFKNAQDIQISMSQLRSGMGSRAGNDLLKRVLYFLGFRGVDERDEENYNFPVGIILPSQAKSVEQILENLEKRQIVSRASSASSGVTEDVKQLVSAVKAMSFETDDRLTRNAAQVEGVIDDLYNALDDRIKSNIFPGIGFTFQQYFNKTLTDEQKIKLIYLLGLLPSRLNENFPVELAERIKPFMEFVASSKIPAPVLSHRLGYGANFASAEISFSTADLNGGVVTVGVSQEAKDAMKNNLLNQNRFRPLEFTADKADRLRLSWEFDSLVVMREYDVQGREIAQRLLEAGETVVVGRQGQVYGKALPGVTRHESSNPYLGREGFQIAISDKDARGHVTVFLRDLSNREDQGIEVSLAADVKFNKIKDVPTDVAPESIVESLKADGITLEDLNRIVGAATWAHSSGKAFNAAESPEGLRIVTTFKRLMPTLDLASEAFYQNLQMVQEKFKQDAARQAGVNASSTVGGINFDPSLMDLQIKRDGNGVPLPVPMQDLENINIEGLFPVIINISPASVIQFPLLSNAEEEEQKRSI